MLTACDTNMVSYLAKRDFATRQELQQFYSSQTNTKQRLWRLIQDGIVEKIPIRNIFKIADMTPLLRGVFHHSSCVYKVSGKIDERYKMDESEFRHSALVTYLLKYFETNYPDCSIYRDRRLVKDKKLKIVPDIDVKGDGFRLAIELERTRKSKDRYIDKFVEYNRSLYTHVIYYTVSEEMEDYLKSNSSPYKFIAVTNILEIDTIQNESLGILKLKEFLEMGWLK